MIFETLSHKNAIKRVAQGKICQKIEPKAAIFWLLLGNFLAILAIFVHKIGYFQTLGVENTGLDPNAQ